MPGIAPLERGRRHAVPKARSVAAGFATAVRIGRERCGNSPANDDTGGSVESITLPAKASSVARARTFVRDVAGHVDAIEEAVLMTSELVANVVVHARTDVTLDVHVGLPLRVEVHDGVAATAAFRALIGRGPPQVAAASLGGRGLAIVHNLATRIGLDDGPSGGKVVWFEL